ncbi:MAG: hypothetical protein AAF513_17375 [Pseudomonadota bacterium]
MQRIHHVGKEDHVVAPQEARGQGIEKVRAQKIHLRHFLQANFVTALEQRLMQIRVLLLGDFYAVALDVGDKPGLNKDCKDGKQADV